MSKYKVGDELIIVENENEDVKKLMEMTKLDVSGDYAKLSWGIKILNVEYNMPNVVLTYRNHYGEINKVFAVCKDIDNFDQQKFWKRLY